MANISVETLPPYRHYGRYVCDWHCRELHLFNTLPEAIKFAQQWGRDCNIGWLAPVYDKGKNRKPSAHESQIQIAKNSTVFDHRQ